MRRHPFIKISPFEFIIYISVVSIGANLVRYIKYQFPFRQGYIAVGKRHKFIRPALRLSPGREPSALEIAAVYCGPGSN